MSVMSAALNPLRSYEPFIQFMISMQNPLYGAAVGALFTAVVQSSSATTGILIVMASLPKVVLVVLWTVTILWHLSIPEPAIFVTVSTIIVILRLMRTVRPPS